MDQDELKTLVERIATTIEDYLELVAVKKNMMTQKTYANRRAIDAETLGAAVGRLIELRLNSKTAPYESSALDGLESEVKNLGLHLLEFIDKRIQDLPAK